MNAALWTGQIFLALVFALSGSLKPTMSRQRMLETGQAGALTGWAAVGLVVVMIGAMASHGRLAIVQHKPAAGRLR
jgi:uncharacterized membrane protein YphA (DoxX/SURF4 family)